MKISLNWLKNYIRIDETPEELADILTNIGLEVEEVEYFRSIDADLDGLVIGEVLEADQHPDADKLKVTRVDVGDSEGTLQIVCGAPNVAKGQKVVVATVGTKLNIPGHGEIKIKKAKLRGVESIGMICAEDEIGLGDDHDGIMVLPDDAPVGQSFESYYKVYKDVIFHIGLTPNRADAQSHIGVARDLAAYFNSNNEERPLNWPDVDSFMPDAIDHSIDIELPDPELCPRYTGLTLTDIQVGESPDWLKNYLLATGLRPISNVVDITNFILLELGQPLHAFDADAIKGDKVIVKTLPEGTPFVTLDEEERKLSSEDLMICNAEEGMCIAGVFGGLHSGVSYDTKTVFLESAHFNPVSIRRTAGRHNLLTDAASRFEKGTDPDITIYAIKRAALLLKELAGARIVSEINDVYPEPIAPFKVALRKKRIPLLTGVDIPDTRVENILTNLGIEIVIKTDDHWDLSVPPFKVDVTREADVIEELIRIYGLNNIPLPGYTQLSPAIRRKPDHHRIQEEISGVLVGAGFRELFSSSIIQGAYFEEIMPELQEQLVKLLKSSNAELDTLRPVMLFSGLEAIRYNLNRNYKDLKFFEFGKTYRKAGDKYLEKWHLSLFMTGNTMPESWRKSGTEVDFYNMKSYAELILKRMGIVEYKEKTVSDLPFSYALSYSVKGYGEILSIGKIRKSILKGMDLKQDVWMADFNWDAIVEMYKGDEPDFKAPSKFPAMRRDLALVIDKKVTYAEIRDLASRVVPQKLADINLFDVYESEKLGADKVSYAVSFVFRDDEKTLTDKEVDKMMSKLITSLEKELHAGIRK